MSNYSKEIELIEISNIRPNPYQPRKKFNSTALEELSKSIKQFGVLQPINVRRLNNNKFELVAGERRLRASKLAGLEKIPALVIDLKEKETAIIAMMENLQREDLDFIEEANGYKNLIEDHGFTQKEIAEQLGKSQSTIANKIRILNLPEEVQRKLIDNNLSERHGRALLKLPTNDLREEVLGKIIENNFNVKQTEEIIQNIIEELIKEDMDGEIKSSKTKNKKKTYKIKHIINTKIYLNTLKNAYKAIKDTGIDVGYEEIDRGDSVEVIVKIPKS